MAGLTVVIACEKLIPALMKLNLSKNSNPLIVKSCQLSPNRGTHVLSNSHWYARLWMVKTVRASGSRRA